MKVNLHTHTMRCHHAKGTDEEYVLAAIDAGFDLLGFSDHVPFPYENYINGGKMTMQEMDDYLVSLVCLRQKYAGRIQIYCGMECEPVPRFLDYLTELRDRLDYMILGSHGDESRREAHSSRLKEPSQLWDYFKTTLAGMESGLYLYVAHPDIMFGSYPAFDETAKQVSRELCRAANSFNLPLEYNLLGLEKGHGADQLGYPCREFWEIAAQEYVKVVIGVDAHRPEHLLQANMEQTANMLSQMGLQVYDNPLDLK